MEQVIEGERWRGRVIPTIRAALLVSVDNGSIGSNLGAGAVEDFAGAAGWLSRRARLRLG